MRHRGLALSWLPADPTACPALRPDVTGKSNSSAASALCRARRADWSSLQASNGCGGASCAVARKRRNGLEAAPAHGALRAGLHQAPTQYSCAPATCGAESSHRYSDVSCRVAQAHGLRPASAPHLCQA